jgi:hypothetical protein
VAPEGADEEEQQVDQDFDNDLPIPDEDEEELPPPEPPPQQTRAGRPYRSWRQGRHEGYERRGFVAGTEATQMMLNCANRPNRVSTKRDYRGIHRYDDGQRIRKKQLNESFLANLDWDGVVDGLRQPKESNMFNTMKTMMQHSRIEGGDEIEDFNPLMLAAKASSEDNPNWNQAMNGPYADEYWEAAKVEIQTLSEKMEAWDVVPIKDGMNILGSTWAFKCKRFPDGRVRKFKGRFCVRGDQQIEGVDFTETYSPVVQWSTIRIMEILSLILDLKTAQADVTAAFLHAPIDEGENVYVRMPRGFSKPGYCLKLKRSLYGLRQSPRNFFKFIKAKLESIEIYQSSFDECLFIGNRVILVSWVDDILLYSPKEEWIDETIEKLRGVEIDVSKELDTAGFLGVDINRNVGIGPIDDKHRSAIELTQTGLIDRIVTALGLDEAECKRFNTPAEEKALGKCEDAEPLEDNYNYASVVGMLLYLAGHTRPDIAFAVHQCARFTFGPRKPHGVAIKRIGKYLKNTRTKGIILNPSKELKIDAYPDADFAGLWGSEDPQDPICVRSRTGFVICVADCPVIWVSKLQTEISTSTLEAEYVALGHCCRSLFPLMRTVKGVAKVVGMSTDETTKMHVKIHEDNAGALKLAKMEYPRMTPRTKWYAVKYHWFRSQLEPNGIELVKIDTAVQKGDIMTKGFLTKRFETLRKLLSGW